MGVLSRFKDIMAANINALLDSVEDPAKMVDQTLRDLESNLAEVKKETAGVMAEETRCRRTLDAAISESTKWDGYARKAVAAGNDGDAREFLAKKAQCDAKVAEATQVYDLAKDNADKMRQMHDKLVNDISILKSRRETLKAKVAVAKTQERLNTITAGKNVSGTMAKFDELEGRIDNRLDSAMAMADLNSAHEDAATELAARYDTDKYSVEIDDELAKLKAEMNVQ